MKKLLTVLIVLSGNTYAGLFGPDNYEDCILEGLKDAKTDLAVKLVNRACFDKFPSNTAPPPKPKNVKAVREFICEATGQTPLIIKFDRVRKTLAFEDAETWKIRRSANGFKHWTELSPKRGHYWIFEDFDTTGSLQVHNVPNGSPSGWFSCSLTD